MPEFYPEIDLLSVHIPKTAGTSFRLILEKQYGSGLECLYGGPTTMAIWNGEGLKINRKEVRAIHGHFPASQSMKSQCPNAKLITWIRNPVDRIISYYYFWQTLAPHGNPCHDRFLSDRPSLREFCREDYMIGEREAFFGGLAIESFDFVGVVEEFVEGLDFLSRLFGWNQVDVLVTNENRQKPRVSDGERIEVERLLRDEVEAYEYMRSYSRSCFR